MVTDIYHTPKKFLDLFTNAEVLKTTQKATIPRWRKAQINQQANTKVEKALFLQLYHPIIF